MASRRGPTVGKIYLGGVRIDQPVYDGIVMIANRRGELISFTVEKALEQYIAADKRKRKVK